MGRDWEMERFNLHDREFWRVCARSAGFQSAALATNLKISVRQLHRYSRNLFNRSLQEWLNELRLSQAAEELFRQGSVKAAAFELGFKQVSHFSREFKKYYGLSPTQFIAWVE